jgi:hypothetical protein
MSWKGTLLAIVAAVGLWAFWHYYEVKGGESRKAREDEGKKVFAAFDPSSIGGLDLQSEDQPLVRLRKESGTWMLVTPVAARADSSQVENLLQQIKNMDKEETVAESPQPSELKEFGLADSRNWLSFQAVNGAARTLWFGIKNPGESFVYVRVSGSPSVMLVGAYEQNALLKKANELRDRKVWALDTSKLVRVVSTFKEAAFILEKGKDGSWSLAGSKDRTSQDRVNGLLSQLANLQVKDFVSEDGRNEASYGLSHPKEALELSEAGVRQTHVLERGGMNASKSAWFARIRGEKLVFSLEKAAIMGRLADEKNDFVDRAAFAVKPYEIDKVVVEAAGNTRTYEKKEGDWVRLPILKDSKEKPAPDTFLNSLSSAKYEGDRRAGEVLKSYEGRAILYDSGRQVEEVRWSAPAGGRRQASSSALSQTAEVSTSLFDSLPQ